MNITPEELAADLQRARDIARAEAISEAALIARTTVGDGGTIDQADLAVRIAEAIEQMPGANPCTCSGPIRDPKCPIAAHQQEASDQNPETALPVASVKVIINGAEYSVPSDLPLIYTSIVSRVIGRLPKSTDPLYTVTFRHHDTSDGRLLAGALHHGDGGVLPLYGMVFNAFVTNRA